MSYKLICLYFIVVLLCVKVECNCNDTNYFICDPNYLLYVENITMINNKLIKLRINGEKCACNDVECMYTGIPIAIGIDKEFEPYVFQTCDDGIIYVISENSISRKYGNNSFISNDCKMYIEESSAELYKKRKITEGILMDLEIYSNIINGEDDCGLNKYSDEFLNTDAPIKCDCIDTNNVLFEKDLNTINNKLIELCNKDVLIIISVSRNNSIINVKWNDNFISNTCKLFIKKSSAKLYKEGRLVEGILKNLDIYSNIIKYGEGICYNYTNIIILIALIVAILVVLIMLVYFCKKRYNISRVIKKKKNEAM